MTMQIQVRRDTAANWTAENPTLTAGELGYETDTGKLKMGDGATAWNTLGYLVIGDPVEGDIIYGDATPKWAKLARGANDEVLTLVAGLPAWAAGAGGGGGVAWESVRCPNRYFSSNVVNDPMGAMSASNKDKGYAMPFLVPCQQSFDRIGTVVQVAGSANSKIRLGIYTDDGQAYPDALVVDSGELATNTTGLKEAAIDELLDAGLYWLVCNATSDGMGDPNLKTFDYWRCTSPLGWASPPASYPEYFYKKDPMNYGALPATFPVGATMTKDTDMIAIFLRKKNATP